jgi:two-component system sensor histidine kinase MprB
MTPPYAAAQERFQQRLRQLDERWRDLPLRTRLTSTAAAAATLTIVAVVAVAYLAVRHELRAQIDRQLHRQTGEVTLSPGAFDAFTGERGVDVDTGVGDLGGYAQLVSAVPPHHYGGSVLPINASDVAVASTGRGQVLRDSTYAGRHVRMITVPLQDIRGGAVQIALPLHDVDRQLHALAVAFILLALGGLAVTVVASWGAVRRTLRPVQSLTETAEEIAETRDLTLRIESAGNDELGRLAASFNTMLDALERSLAQQRQLVVDASHELRTPLASLRTNVEVLNDVDRLTPAQRKALLAGIVSQLEELTGLVADVVELARGDAPASTFEDVAWEEVVDRAVERARRHWPQVTFRGHTDPVVVRGVVSRLERAVANMLDNAGKFSPAGSTVDVELTSDGRFTVADRGPGVPDDALPHVFDRFFRADEARALPGSGLGLAIVKQVVDGLGGTIELHNRPDGGAVATMTLPVVARPEPDVAVPMPIEETLFQ